jgi:hypothetical protein
LILFSELFDGLGELSSFFLKVDDEFGSFLCEIFLEAMAFKDAIIELNLELLNFFVG